MKESLGTQIETVEVSPRREVDNEDVRESTRASLLDRHEEKSKAKQPAICV